MKPFERLRQAAQLFRSVQPDRTGWFDASNPDCQEGERLLQLGQASSAEEVFARAAADPQHHSRPRRVRARILMALSTARLQQAKLAEAERNALDAQALLDESKADMWIETSDCYDLLGQIARQQGDPVEAAARFRHSLSLLRSRKDPPAEAISAGLRRLGEVLKESGEADAGIERMEEAVDVARSGCGARSAELADALIDLSHAEAARGHFDDARRLATEALEIHRSTLGSDSGATARDLEVLAQFSRSANDLEATVAYLEQALLVRERQIGGNSTDLALLMITLADIHTMLGRLAPALELMQQAVGKLTPAHDEKFAQALEKLGSIYVRTGRHEDAFDCFRNARQVWQEHPEQHAEELASNSGRLAELESSLPVIEQPQIEEDPDQPGISVLLPDPPPSPIPNSRTVASAPLTLIPGVRPSNAARVVPVPVPAPASSPHVAELQLRVMAEAYPVASPVQTAVPSSMLRLAKVDVVQMPAPPAATAPPAPAPSVPVWHGWEDLAFELITVPGQH